MNVVTATSSKEITNDESDAWTNSSNRESGGDASTTKERVEKEMRSEIALKEEQTIAIVRVLVILAIICSAVAVSVAVWFFATGNETATFELEYKGYVKTIQTLVVWEVKYNMALLQQLSGTTTSTAVMTEQTFPNVVRFDAFVRLAPTSAHRFATMYS